MTTATTQVFATRTARPFNAVASLLAILSVILGVSLRESLAAQSTAQEDAGYTWGL